LQDKKVAITFFIFYSVVKSFFFGKSYRRDRPLKKWGLVMSTTC